MPENEETQETQQTLGTLKTELETEKAASATLKEAIATKDARIAELQAEGEALRAERSNLQTLLSEAKQASEAAIGKYREALILANPDVPAELIVGTSIDELAGSVEKGKAVVAAVTARLQTQTSAAKVPAGAPTRQGISTEGMSPRELIAAGIKPKGGI